MTEGGRPLESPRIRPVQTEEKNPSLWSGSRWPRALLLWLWRHPYGSLTGILLAVVALPFVALRDSSAWIGVYIEAARHLKEGRDFYASGIGYLYPPFMAWAAIPFMSWPPVAARAFWFAACAASFIFLCRWAWRAAGGGPLENPRRAPRSEHAICLLGLALGIRYAVDGFAHHQTDLPVSALVAGGSLALLRSRTFLAASAFGLAAGIKCTPLLFCLYLLWRRRWVAAAWVVSLAVGLNLLPNLAGSPPGGGIWLGEWLRLYLLPMSSPEHQPGIWGADTILNQSLSGALNRWTTTCWAWGENGFQVVGLPDPLGPEALKWLTYGIEAVLLIGSFLLMGFARPAAAGIPAGGPSDGGGEVGPPRTALECSIVVLLMVLLSPMSSKPHFATLVLPGFALARQMVTRRSAVLGAILIAAILSGFISIKDLWGRDWASLTLWYGAVTSSALFALLGCAVGLVQARTPMGEATAPGQSSRNPSPSDSGSSRST